MHSIHCILTTSCLVQVGAGRPPVSAPDANHPVRHVADTASSPTLSDSMNVKTRLKKGEEWLHGGIFVMPGCNPEFEAPTTLAGSDATHRMSHKLSIQIRYQVPGDISLNATTICLPIILDSVSPSTCEVHRSIYRANIVSVHFARRLSTPTTIRSTAAKY